MPPPPPLPRKPSPPRGERPTLPIALTADPLPSPGNGLTQPSSGKVPWLPLLVGAGLIIALFVPFVGALLAPKALLCAGIILSMLFAGACIKVGTDAVTRSHRGTRREKWTIGLWLTAFGFVSVGLVVAGWAGVGYKANRERLAANKAAEEAEGPRRTSEANAKVKALVDQATTALNTGEVATAREKVQAALAVPHASAFADARNLDQQISTATDSTKIRSALAGLSDESLQALKKSGALPAMMATGYKGLDRYTAKLATTEASQVIAAREQQRSAELEAERKRKEAPVAQGQDKAKREVVGTWQEAKPRDIFTGRITIYEAGGKFYAEHGLTDGSVGKGQVVEMKDKRGRKFLESAADGEGDYYLVNKKGDLEMYLDGGPGKPSNLIWTAKALSAQK